MRKLSHIFAAAVVGVATASFVVLMRQKGKPAKKQEVEDIHRWEDEGGQVLARRQASPSSTAPTNPV